jgi:hypothetical protein
MPHWAERRGPAGKPPFFDHLARVDAVNIRSDAAQLDAGIVEAYAGSIFRPKSHLLR